MDRDGAGANIVSIRPGGVRDPLPGLYPRSGISSFAPDSERKVFEAIGGTLPRGWYAWYSLKLRAGRGDVVEGDFVIADPEAGILILEVKGGRIEKRSGAWYQNGQPMRMDPLQQAMRAGKCLIAKYRERRYLFPPIGELVVFPDTQVEAQPTQGNLEDLVIGASDLKYLEGCLPTRMKKALPKDKNIPLDDSWILALHEWWCESWPLALDLSSSVKAEIGRRLRLDSGQFEALQAVLENDIVVVRGGAGTGKTILARELARREAAAGRRVLLLTYTEALARQIAGRMEAEGLPCVYEGRSGAGEGGGSSSSASEVTAGGGAEKGAANEGRTGSACLISSKEGEVAGGDAIGMGRSTGSITVASIGRFALRRLRETGFDEPESYEPAFWEKVTKRAADTRALWKGCGWDTVIVDEAQDLGKDEWNIATRCALKPPRIWCFADESQAYWEERKIPDKIRKRCVLYNLGKPYRCPAGIQALADAYVGMVPDTAAVEADKAKGIIAVRACEDARRVRDAVDEEVGKLIAEGFKPGDIAVVSLRGLLFEGSIVKRGRIAGHEAVMATAKDLAGRIVCDTFLRYKGLERPAVVVTDLQHEVKSYGVRMNIALSRAYGVLRIVGAKAEMEKDGILMRIAG